MRIEDIKNVPCYASKCAYIVYRVYKGEMWFWGAWNNLQKAAEIAETIQGSIWINSDAMIKPSGNIIDGYTCPNCGRRLRIKQHDCLCGLVFNWE